MKNQKYIIFTDLDGTLLDHHTYDYSEALPAIEKIKQQNIPLILTSSKTRVEMDGYQKELDIDQFPFIVENGSAIYSNSDFFNGIEVIEKYGNKNCIKLGKTYAELKNFLIEISRRYNYNIFGFHNTDINEIMEKTGLDIERVELAMQREYSIPLFYDDKAQKILIDETEKNNLQMLFGGRFMHILGNTNKGKALKVVQDAYKAKLNSDSVVCIAIGDTQNDIAMLENADIKILVKRYNNEYDERVQIDNLIYSPYIGPKGWNHSILEILSLGDKNE